VLFNQDETLLLSLARQEKVQLSFVLMAVPDMLSMFTLMPCVLGCLLIHVMFSSYSAQGVPQQLVPSSSPHALPVQQSPRIHVTYSVVFDRVILICMGF
jgi:hypothetical protein